MILDGANHASEVLDDQNITDTMGGNKVFWGLAKSGTTGAFITYVISHGASETKEGRFPYKAEIWLFDKSLTDAATKAKAVIGHIKNNLLAQQHRWKLESSDGDYTSQEGDQAYIKITYNFKL